MPSNFDKTAGFTGAEWSMAGVLENSNKTLLPGTPWHNFAPRIGVAWQPLGNKFVVRAGYGLFYDRVYGNLLIDNQLNLPPYAGTAGGSFPASHQATSLAQPVVRRRRPLAWTPRFHNGNPAIHPGFGGVYANLRPGVHVGFAAAWATGSRSRSSTTSTSSMSSLTTGSPTSVTSVRTASTCTTTARTSTSASSVAGAPNKPTAASGAQNLAMVHSSIAV